eukprot:6254179-Ditylum_brightwellii.AAC.1
MQLIRIVGILMKGPAITVIHHMIIITIDVITHRIIPTVTTVLIPLITIMLHPPSHNLKKQNQTQWRTSCNQ